MVGWHKRDIRSRKTEMTEKGLLNSPFRKRTVQRSFLDTPKSGAMEPFFGAHFYSKRAVKKRKQDTRTGNSREINRAYEFGWFVQFNAHINAARGEVPQATFDS